MVQPSPSSVVPVKPTKINAKKSSRKKKSSKCALEISTDHQLVPNMVTLLNDPNESLSTMMLKLRSELVTLSGKKDYLVQKQHPLRRSK